MAEKLLTLVVLAIIYCATENTVKINSKKFPSPPNSRGTIIASPTRRKEITINDYFSMLG